MALLEQLNKLTAQNIFLDENTGGKGRYFKSRFLQAGLVKYSFGVCILSKETIDKFVDGFVGCPVIINHKDVTNESAKDDRVGVISRVWYDEKDGWFWCEGVIFDEEAISLIESGYNVSCQYEITEYSNNTTKALHNGNPYDKVILNGKPEHLAIVKTPRYESAMIAVNALDLTAENEDKWITIKPNGEDGKISMEELDKADKELEKSNKEFYGKSDTVKNTIIEAINELKENNMFNKLFNKKEKAMELNKDEMKELFIDCIQDVLKAQNEAEEEKKKIDDAENEDEEKEEKAENKKACNEDKRKLIDEVAGMMKSAGCDDEVIRTAIAKMEKIGYDKSEVGTADNCGKKGKNEDEEEKEEALNKAKNSIEALKGILSQGEVRKPASKYITKSQAIELGNQLF